MQARTKITSSRKASLTTPMPIMGDERLRVLEKVAGMWKNRKPDPIKEVEKGRQEWENRLKKQEALWLRLREKNKIKNN